MEPKGKKMPIAVNPGAFRFVHHIDRHLLPFSQADQFSWHAPIESRRLHLLSRRNLQPQLRNAYRVICRRLGLCQRQGRRALAPRASFSIYFFGSSAFPGAGFCFIEDKDVSCRYRSERHSAPQCAN
jgi:hypothetical protein